MSKVGSQSIDSVVELKPCPFCRAVDEALVTTSETDVAGPPTFYWVRCNSCESEGPGGDDQAEAHHRWNTRALSPPDHIANAGKMIAPEMAGELAELRAFKERVLAAAKFVTPVTPEQIDAAIYADVAGGMSLRNCALKHGLAFGQVRGAAKRIALLATKEQPDG